MKPKTQQKISSRRNAKATTNIPATLMSSRRTHPITAIAKKTKGSASSVLFVSSEDDVFWHRLGIFPEALRELPEFESIRDDALKILCKIGRGNLRLLCDECGLHHRDSASEHELASTLLSSSDVETIVHLREFMRRRTAWIENTFDQVFPVSVRNERMTRLLELSGKREKLRPFTRLLMLYRQGAGVLTEIYVRGEWYSRRTTSEFESTKELLRISTRLSKASGRLALAIQRSNDDRGVSLLKVHDLLDGTTICAFVREYGAVVKRDFKRSYSVLHGCGLCLVGFVPSEKRVIFRGGSRTITEAVVNELRDILATELKSLGKTGYQSFDLSKFQDAVLGGYREDDLQLVGITFRRSPLTGSASLCLDAADFEPSLRTALIRLREKAVIQVHSPSDVSSLKVLFGGRLAELKTEQLKNGAIRFKFDNAGWEPTTQANFEAAFQSTFHVPVGQWLPPGNSRTDSIACIGYLLCVKSDEDVLGHHREDFRDLLDREILTTASRQIRS